MRYASYLPLRSVSCCDVTWPIFIGISFNLNGTGDRVTVLNAINFLLGKYRNIKVVRYGFIQVIWDILLPHRPISEFENLEFFRLEWYSKSFQDKKEMNN